MREAKGLAPQPLMIKITLTLTMIATWLLTHRHRGFSRDGQLYAIQALAKLNPAIRLDVYLSDASRDRFSIFSHIYALLIVPLGLQNAELLLFVLCTLGFLVGAWVMAHALSDSDSAWLAIILLITTVGTYGAFSIFQYSESYLTARSLAEALIVTALAVHFRGQKVTALAIAVGAMFIHPLMALPGVLLLVCLWMPTRTAVFGALSGALGALGLAIVVHLSPETAGFFGVMDADWLEVVRERSPHLFLQDWRSIDWAVVARTFISLCFTTLVIEDRRIRCLCAGAALVGGSGLAIALIAGSVGPIAILLQGQAWRWIWVTTFVSVLLTAATVLRAWRDETCGPICSIFAVSAWWLPVVYGAEFVSLALILWSLRSRIHTRLAQYLRWVLFALVAIILAWFLIKCCSLLTSPRVGSSGEPASIDRLRSMFGLPGFAVLLIGPLWYFIKRNGSTWKLACVAVLLTVSSILTLPSSFEPTVEVSRAQIDEFSEWRSAIPPSANVLMLPTPASASFVWFTLGRPSYYSQSQSAGVVFSRMTALEIRRRSEVLLPVMQPDWKILSRIMQESHAHKTENSARPLTSKSLLEICGDTQLGFVIAKESLGFDPIRHTHAGPLKDWNLYDCRRVRSGAPAA